ncbi:MAG: hypothetical protein HEQ39_09505 [Rhizobacter sp.]
MAETIDRPKGLYQGPGGIWVIDKIINGQRVKWSTKSTDLAEAKTVLDRYTTNLNERLHGSEWREFVNAMAENPRSWLSRTAQSLAYRGRKIGKGCTVDIQHLAAVLMRSGGRCEITGIGFDMRRGDKGTTPPFHPSFDRRDSSLGYTQANTRVVCLCVNLCIRDWGDEVMKKVGRAMVLKELADIQSPKLPEPQLPNG